MASTTADTVAHVKEVYGDDAMLLSAEQQTLTAERLEFQLGGGRPTLVILHSPEGGDLAGFVCPCCGHTAVALPPLVSEEDQPDV